MSVDSFETGSDQPRTNRVVRWILLEANRWVVTGLISVAVFVLLVACSEADVTPLRTIVESQGGSWYIFSSLIAPIVTGVSIVVMINQLVLSQELGAFGDQYERMENSMAARREIEAGMGVETSPTEPADYMLVLAAAIEERANALEAAMRAESDGEARREILEYADELADDARLIQENVRGAEFGTFEVVWSGLNFEYSRKIHAGRSLRAEFGDELAEDATDHLDGTITLLTSFSPVREHFKTLYFQWELIDLSRALVTIAVPALAVIAMFNMYVDAATFTGTTLGVDDLVWATSAGFVIGISPFVVFTAYILRITTIAKRTLAIGPFVLHTGGARREGGSLERLEDDRDR